MDDFVNRMREKAYAMVTDDDEREAIKQNTASVKETLSDPKCKVTLCGTGEDTLDIEVPKETIDDVDSSIRAVQADALADLAKGERSAPGVVMGMYKASTEAMLMMMRDTSQRYLAAHPDLDTDKYWGAGATMSLQVWMNRRFGLKMNVDAFFILTAMAKSNGPDRSCVEIITLVDGGAMTQMSNAECIRVFGEDEYAKIVSDAHEALERIDGDKLLGIHVFRMLDGSFMSLCEGSGGMIYPAPLFAEGEPLFRRFDMRGLS